MSHNNFKKALKRVEATITLPVNEEIITSWDRIINFNGIRWLERNLKKENWSFFLDIFNDDPKITFSFLNKKEAVLFKLANI